MYRGIGSSRPFFYIKDNIDKDRYFIDDFSTPIDTTAQFGTTDNVFISNGTLNVVREFNLLGTLVLLD